jgi:uncharacterized integral membrane protein
MQIAITILILLVVGAIAGSVLNFAGLFLGIPFVLIFIGFVVTKEAVARQARIMQMKRFRQDARTRKVEFSEEDKHTLVR